MSRLHPARLAEKLLEIRSKIDGGLSQNSLIKRMRLQDEVGQDRIFKFERDVVVLEPPLYVLCAYADVANVLLEIIDQGRFGSARAAARAAERFATVDSPQAIAAGL